MRSELIEAARTTDPEAPTRLAIDAKEFAEMLGISKRSIQTYDVMGLIPSGFKLGGRKLWNLAEIHEWMAAGSPNRDIWMNHKKSNRSR